VLPSIQFEIWNGHGLTHPCHLVVDPLARLLEILFGRQSRGNEANGAHCRQGRFRYAELSQCGFWITFIKLAKIVIGGQFDVELERFVPRQSLCFSTGEYAAAERLEAGEATCTDSFMSYLLRKVSDRHFAACAANGILHPRSQLQTAGTNYASTTLRDFDGASA
jgi:hypothetical protein